MAEREITHRGTVYPWQCDHIGHMNIMWYVGKFDEAIWQLFNWLGITPSYLRKRKRGMAAVEQQIEYKHELRPGDIVTVRSHVIAMREKVIRFHHEMGNEETGEVAATTTLTAVHIDTQTRKSCAFPAEIRQRGRGMILELTQDTGA